MVNIRRKTWHFLAVYMDRIFARQQIECDGEVQNSRRINIKKSLKRNISYELERITQMKRKKSNPAE